MAGNKSYITQQDLFYRYAEIMYLPPMATLLWTWLFQMFNRSGWKEWIKVDNSRLMSLMGVSKNTLIKNRSILVEKGLIDYRKGSKGRPGSYRLKKLTKDEIGNPYPEKGSNSEHYSEHNTGQNIGPILNLKRDSKCAHIKKEEKRIKKEDTLSHKRESKVSDPTTNKDDLSFKEFCNQLKDSWNEMTIGTNIPAIRTLGDNRQKKLKTVLKTHSKEDLFEAIEKVKGSSFLRGEVKDFTATFDFVFRTGYIDRVLEGNYDDRKNKPNVNKQNESAGEFLRNFAKGDFNDQTGNSPTSVENANVISNVVFQIDQ